MYPSAEWGQSKSKIIIMAVYAKPEKYNSSDYTFVIACSTDCYCGADADHGEEGKTLELLVVTRIRKKEERKKNYSKWLFLHRVPGVTFTALTYLTCSELNS